jgi:hypothetical protein
MTLSWKRDGDQHVAVGGMGEYRITEWVLRDGSDFVIYVKRKHDGASKNIGGFSSLKNAQQAAEGYDGYRATA